MNHQDHAKQNHNKQYSTTYYSILVASGILLSRISGFVREWFFARYLGNSNFAGVFRAAQSIPNFIQNLLGEGVLSASFIPVYSRLMAEGKEEIARTVAGAIFSLLTTVVAILVTIGIILAPVLTKLIVPGFTGDNYELAVQLVRIIFPATGILAISSWCLGILNSHKKFFLSYSVQVLMNLTIIATLIFFKKSESLIFYVSWGGVVGSLLVLTVQLFPVLKLTKGLNLSFNTKLSEVRETILNFLPVVAGRGVIQISAYVDRVLASFISPIAVSTLANAQIVYMLPVSLFGMSTSAAELPVMSSAIGTEDEIYEQIRKQLTIGLSRIAFFMVPSVTAFLILGDVIVAALYQTGKFSRGDTVLVWYALAGSTIGLISATFSRLYSAVFYALRNTVTPFKIAIVRVILCAVLGYLPLLFNMDPIWRIVGITASAGIAGWVELGLLKLNIVKKLGKTRLPSYLLAKLWGASCIAALLSLEIKKLIPHLHPFINAIFILGSYGIFYIGLTLVLKISEATLLLNTIFKVRNFFVKD